MEERAHILIGLATAVENIDEIIKIIKSSKDTDIAKKSLNKNENKEKLKLILLIEKEKILLVTRSQLNKLMQS